MSGSYTDAAAPTIAADIEQAAAQLAPAMERHVHYQEQAAQFISVHGAAVNAGHPQVGVVPPALSD